MRFRTVFYERENMKATMLLDKYQNKWGYMCKENKFYWRKFQVFKRQDKLRKERILQVV